MSRLLSPTPKAKNAILKVWTRVSREERDSEICSDKADSQQFFSWDTQSWEGFGNVCYLLGILWMQVMKWYPDMASKLATNWGSADFPIHCQNREYYLFHRGDNCSSLRCHGMPVQSVQLARERENNSAFDHSNLFCFYRITPILLASGLVLSTMAWLCMVLDVLEFGSVIHDEAMGSTNRKIKSSASRAIEVDFYWIYTNPEYIKIREWFERVCLFWATKPTENMKHNRLSLTIYK